mmetsp:Transcript_2480/g.2767  ORF Transcript_2480/g.2767 Transcript_2480/m.2767 type:complete len:385 (-) Transcript_2480:74-1228(-)
MTDIRSKTKALIAQAYAKIVQLVVQSRVVFPSNEPVEVNRNFHTTTVDVVSLLNELRPWNNDIFLPLDLNIYFSTRNNDPSTKHLIEQWTIRYERLTIDRRSQGNGRQVELGTLNKMLIVIMRNVHAYVRCMPGHSLYRQKKRNKTSVCALTHNITYPGRQSNDYVGFKSHVTMDFTFGTIPTQFGNFKLGVKYRTNCNFDISRPLLQNIVVNDYKPRAEPKKVPIPKKQQQQYSPVPVRHSIPKYARSPPHDHQIGSYETPPMSIPQTPVAGGKLSSGPMSIVSPSLSSLPDMPPFLTDTDKDSNFESLPMLPATTPPFSLSSSITEHTPFQAGMIKSLSIEDYHPFKFNLDASSPYKSRIDSDTRDPEEPSLLSTKVPYLTD